LDFDSVLFGLCQADKRPNSKGFSLRRIGPLDRFNLFNILSSNFTGIILLKEVNTYSLHFNWWLIRAKWKLWLLF